MPLPPETLVIVAGSTEPVEVILYDDAGELENLSLVESATLEIAESLGGTSVLSRSTGAGNLTVDAANSKLVATLTGVEADALPAGVFVCGAALRFGATANDWKQILPLTVEIFAKGAPTP